MVGVAPTRQSRLSGITGCTCRSPQLSHLLFASRIRRKDEQLEKFDVTFDTQDSYLTILKTNAETAMGFSWLCYIKWRRWRGRTFSPF